MVVVEYFEFIVVGILCEVEVVFVVYVEEGEEVGVFFRCSGCGGVCGEGGGVDEELEEVEVKGFYVSSCVILDVDERFKLNKGFVF